LTIENFAFLPSAITTSAGPVTISARNDDFATHTFTIDGVVNVSVFGAGQSANIQFMAAVGQYRFYCQIHAQNATMQGSLTLQ
jgi:plastocyanin